MLDKWLELYEYAKSERSELDAKFKRRMKLYEGTDEVRDRQKGGISNKRAYCYRNLCFELIETQIDNAIPQPKVTPRDPHNKELADELEGYLKYENDRLDAEKLNDIVERETYIQGTSVYHIGWDNLETTPITTGEIFLKFYPISQFYPQPGVVDFKDCEYCFTEDVVSVKWIKKMYNKTVDEDPKLKGLCKLVTAYYFNDDGYVCKIGWVDDKLIFDEEFYEARRVRQCTDCDTIVIQDDICPVCGNNKFAVKPLDAEYAPENIIEYDRNNVDMPPKVLIAKGEEIPFYKIKQLPFVIRKNISKPDSFYGVSDVDILETNQESINKLLTKMEENVLKAGSIITKPKGVNVPKNDETLKMVSLTDPRQASAFGVFNIQANMQQDDILQDRMYQFGRSSLGITDSYQGKRDTTAESGIAKQVSAQQAAARLVSKRRMKSAAYAEIYELMFKFLLAYSDEKRTYIKETPEGEYYEGKFDKYNYIDVFEDKIFYNDRFLFAVDDASSLSTNREAMWKETTGNFQAGTFGHPQDPNTLFLYWTTMKNLGYPLARQALHSLQERAKNEQMPPELQQAIMSNPEVMTMIQSMIKGGENV